MDLKTRVFETLTRIPKGKVATYSQIAVANGTGPRVIGNILHRNLQPERYPCHRVIKSTGELAEGYFYGGKFAQKLKLENEGIEFKNNKVDLSKFGVQYFKLQNTNA